MTAQRFYLYRFKRLSQLGRDHTPLFLSIEQLDRYVAALYGTDPGPYDYQLHTVDAFDAAQAAKAIALQWGSAHFYRGESCYLFRADIYRDVTCIELKASPGLIPLCSLT